MKFRLIFLSEAEFDIQDAELYYREILNKLTDDFIKELYVTIHQVEEQPHIYQIRYRDVRVAPLHCFPYTVHYVITDNEIFIIRVLHTSRDLR